MRFLLGKQEVRFSKVEFCLITGLKFGVIPDTASYVMVENGIHERYFQGRDIEFEKLRAVVRSGGFVQQYDAVKLCLLFMFNWILMGWTREIKSHYGSFTWLRTWTLLMRSRGAHTCIGGPYIVSSMRWMVDGSGLNNGNKKRALMYTPSRRTTYTVYRTHCW